LAIHPGISIRDKSRVYVVAAGTNDRNSAAIPIFCLNLYVNNFTGKHALRECLSLLAKFLFLLRCIDTIEAYLLWFSIMHNRDSITIGDMDYLSLPSKTCGY